MYRTVHLCFRSSCDVSRRILQTRLSSSGISLVQSIKQRGLVKTITSPNLEAITSSNKVALYCGFDPTAPSLHVGNLLALVPLLHFYIHGHKAFALVGGATGKVGDPSGKTTQRDRLGNDLISNNVEAITSQLSRFFINGAVYAHSRGHAAESVGSVEIVNNADWWCNVSFEDYMRDVCHNVRVTQMLARDSVKDRLAGDGLSLAELIYQTMQAYDFWHLHKERGVSLQIGGSDQYGNITAGIDLVRRLRTRSAKVSTAAEDVMGLTVPLLTTASGQKFGKSEGNAVWLDPSMTSPFDLYQYFLRTLDDELELYLKLFTLLPIDEIEALIMENKAEPAKRKAGRILAREMVILVHGQSALDKVNVSNQVLFPNDFPELSTRLTARTIVQVFAGHPSLMRLRRSAVLGARVTSLLVDNGISKSKKEASQLITGGAVSIGGHKVKDIGESVTPDWLIDNKVLLTRIGKNKVLLIELEDDTA